MGDLEISIIRTKSHQDLEVIGINSILNIWEKSIDEKKNGFLRSPVKRINNINR